jgi:hypothetical protein
MQNQIFKPIFSAIKKFSESQALRFMGIVLSFWSFGFLSDKHVKAEDFQKLKNTLILYIFIVLITLLIKRLIYKNTTFELLDDSVKYRRDFINLEQKNVKYSNIKEVKLSQHIIQRLYGIATVLVTTHATTQDAGIEIYDIKEYQEVYDFLIEKTKNNT